ncbi:unnamed protein product, partial [Symbiodinium necroappetens]
AMLTPCWTPSHRRVLKQALAIGMEFAMHKNVVVQGKPKRQWSQLRPVLQGIIQAAVAPPSSKASSAFQGPESTVPVSSTASPGEKSVMLFMTEASAEIVQKWLDANKSINHMEHSAFGSAVGKLSSRLCKCRQDPSSCPVHAQATMTCADLLWAASEVVFEHVPASVPTLAIAMTVMFSDSKNKDTEIPTWCRFLCKKAEQPGDPSVSTEEQPWLPNNNALETLISMRPLYLLDMLCKVVGRLEKKGARARFADFQASRLIELCEYLKLGLKKDKSDIPDEEAHALLVLRLEMLLATMVVDETGWAASWSKLLTYCMADSKLTAEEMKDRAKNVKLGELDLDVPPKFKYMLGEPSESEVKQESLSPEQAKKPSRATSSDEPFQHGETQVRVPDVYAFKGAAGKSSFNVLDVMSLQMQLTAHLFAKAPESQSQLHVSV